MLSAARACVTRLVRTLPILLCTLFLVSATARAAGAPGERPRRVLIVDSFGGSAPPFASHAMAFESALVRELGAEVDLDQVSLDNPRYAQPDMEEAFADLLAKRLARWQPDLVVPTGAPAGQFVAKYRDRLFPKTPVIYSWVDKRTLPADAITNNATFVGQSFDLKNLVEDMLQLDPETNNVVVIFGATPLERYWSAQYQKAFEPFAGRVKFTWVNDLSFEQILDLVSKLPQHSFVLMALLLRDASGVTFNQEAVLERLSAVSRAPINGLFQYQLGRGIVGGRLYQDELSGMETARVAVRILRGEPASSFPPLVIPIGRPTYDWRELRRWHIPESRLSPGSVVLFREPTAWQRYRWYVFTALAVIAAQAVCIFALLVQRKRRRVAEVARRRAEAEVQQKRAQLEHVARVATLGELTTTLTHELKQPLQEIALSSALVMQLLNTPQPDLKEIRETLSSIGDTTQRAGEMIQGMRDMLKRDTPGFTSIDLNQVIRTVERIVHSDAVMQGVAVQLDLLPSLAPVKGDTVQLQQVMLNLMVNAFGAMNKSERDARRLIVRTNSIDASNVLIEVRDNGTGIAPEKIESIFDPFITGKPDGLGMGLSICRTIIERHGGKIWAANNPDRGATFSITLPLTRG
jgi:signal transduction histidine kinase